VAFSILRNDEDAKETVNDTYLKAWNIIPPQRPNHLKAFLGRITRQLSINRLEHNSAKKRAGSQYQLALDELSECIAQSQEDFADIIALRDARNQFLHSLPPEARRVFIRRYWHLHSIAEIAASFSMSESKVKSLLMRTRNKLKQHLTEGGFLHEK
jgi:RNA polymerase sigma-70 factor (ECF subfamily)